MKLITAQSINTILHGYVREIANDFDESDQYYVRIYFKSRQFIIKGLYRFKIIEVGLNGGIDYKIISENIPLSELKAQVKLLK